MSKPNYLPTLGRSLLFPVIMFSQFACQRHPSVNLAAPRAFFPLVPGTIWKYRVTDEVKNTTTTFTDKVELSLRNEGGVVQMAHDGSGSEAAETVVSETVGADSSSQMLIIYKTNNEYITRSFSFGSLGDGSFDSQILSEEPDFLPRLLKPGVTWSSASFPFGALSQDLKIVQTHTSYAEDDIVTVPAGRFAGCLQIKTTAVFVIGPSNAHQESPHLKYIDWYAPNIGLIKTSLQETGLFGEEIARLELVGFGKMPIVKPPSSIVPPVRHAPASPDLME